MKKITLLFFLIVSCLIVNSQTVTTQFGVVQGSVNGSVTQFLGIPFASPPVNTLRWKAPQNPAAWPGILVTNSFAPMCPQKKFTQGSSSYTYTGNEDCLYLNIWTPQTASPTLPVMVFIHGGGNQQGGASEDGAGTQMYIGKNLSERGNVVVITIQYRLGPLGFLVHPGLEPENINNTSGNYAAMDQILALKWIKNNVSAFGGDTSKVMIFGESAGGINVGNLMLTPSASGLFSRACIESATPFLGNYATEKSKGIAYVDSFINTGTDAQKITYMRSLPSDSLVKFETSPLSGGVVGLAWQSVVDNVMFFNFPKTAFENGQFNKVPFMIGSNSDEMSLSVPPTVFPAMVTALINATVPSSLQSQAQTLYPPGSNTTQARQSYIGILTDAQFTSNARRTAQCVSLNQTEPVWRYFFSFKHTVPSLASFGSYHGMELFYVFNNWENATLGSGSFFKPQDDSVQKATLKYWTNFAATGNPNNTGLVNWPQFQSSTDCYLEIKATPNGSQCGLRTQECNLWDASTNYITCISTVGLNEIQSRNNKLATVYPNPTSNTVNIILENKNTPFSIKVYNCTGKLIFNQQNATELDFTSLPSGVYLMSINQEGKNSNTKVIKH